MELLVICLILGVVAVACLFFTEQTQRFFSHNAFLHTFWGIRMHEQKSKMVRPSIVKLLGAVFLFLLLMILYKLYSAL
jgi:hypothetical protein